MKNGINPSQVDKTLLVFRAGFYVHDLVMRRLNGKGDWPAADAAVFDILLAWDGTVNQDFDFFPAIRALDNGRLKFLHEAYLSST